MALLVVSPGPGLAAFLSRSAMSGPYAGFMVLIGITLVDFLFLGLAVLGLATLSAFLGPLFQIIKFTAAFYLIWFGLMAIRNANNPTVVTVTSAASNWKDIRLGAVVTLGNPKAILFYGAFLPTVFDTSGIRLDDFLVICGVLSIISASIYGVYGILIESVRRALEESNLKMRLSQVTGITYIGAGTFIALR